MKAKVMFLAVAAAFADTASSQALPTNPSIATGNGSATFNTTGSSMVVTQGTARAVIDWSTFNIGNGASVQFSQPGASSIAVNRVGLGAGASAIDGMLSANGNVMILNPNGVMFGATAVVNVAGLIASTGNINDANFMAALTPIAITGATGGSISNAGNITITGAGLAAFVAPSLSNSGHIVASSGRITLASAQAATVSFNGGLYEIAVNQGVANGSITNTGTLSTRNANGTVTGGTIVLSALDAANIVSGVINLEGVQQANRIEVHGGEVHLRTDLNAATVTGTSTTVKVCGCTPDLQDAIDIAASGANIEIGAGTYQRSTTLKVNKSVNISGAGEAQTIIDAHTVSGYGMLVTADNVSLRDFTLYGPHANVGNSYGIKVQPPEGSGPSAKLRNFSISHVTSRGAGRAELDLNGVVGATIDHFTALGDNTAGAGIQITDSANVTISNSRTEGNAWGGVALFQANRFFDQQVSNVTVQSNNTFTEANPLYMQDESASLNFGTNLLQGFQYAVRNSANDQFTWLQYQLGNAVGFAASGAAPLSSYIQGWSGTARTQNFYVGSGMSIMQAVDQASTGATVNVLPGNYTVIASNRTLGAGVGGTYDLGLLLYKDGMTLRGVDAAGNPIGSASGVQAWLTAGASTNFGMNHGVTGDNVTIQGLGFKPYAAGPNKTIEIAGDNFTFRNSVVDNRSASGGAGALYFGELLSGPQGEITSLNVTGSIFYDGSVSLQNGVGVTAAGAFEPASSRLITDNAFIGSSNYRFGGLLFTGKMDEVAWRPLPIGSAVATGNSFSGFDESVLVRGQQQGVDLAQIMTTNTFDRSVLVTDAAGNARAAQYLSLGGVTRDKFSIQSSIQAGLDRAQNGDIVTIGPQATAESVVVINPRNLMFNGSTIQSLTVNASGSGIGGSATANGSGGFVFNAPVVLLSDTSLSTTGANIVFNGDIQNAGTAPFVLNLSAGAGDVLLTSGGSSANPLGRLDVAANNFSLAATMWVSGYEIDAAGSVSLSVSTLRSVGSDAGSINAVGDITGSTVSEGPVAIHSDSDVLMTNIISSSDITIEAANAVVANIETPTQVVISAGEPVQITGSAPNVVLDAPSGNLNGNFGDVTNAGSGVIAVNGKQEVPQMLSTSFDPSRILPPEASGNASPVASTDGENVYFSTGEDEKRGARIVRAAPHEAAAALDLGLGVELDLTPQNRK